jgi:integrase/recombinase XerD
MSTIRSFCHYLVDRGLLSDSPAALLDAPKQGQDLPDVLTKEEVARLLAAPGSEGDRALRDTAMLETLYATGLRVSELVNLTLHDIDFDRGVVRCIGKGRKERQVPIGEVARAHLLAYLEHARPALARPAGRSKRGPTCQALFLTSQCKPMTRQGFWKLVKRYALVAGIAKARGASPSGPCGYRYDADLHPRPPRAPARNLRPLSPAGLGPAAQPTRQFAQQIEQSSPTLHPLGFPRQPRGA